MLIAPWLVYFVASVLAALIIGVLVAAEVHTRRAKRLPPAISGGRPGDRAQRFNTIAKLLLAAGVVGGLMFWWKRGHAIVFSGTKPGITYSRYYVIGTAQRGDNELRAKRMGTWIVNETDVPLHVEPAKYDSSAYDSHVSPAYSLERGKSSLVLGDIKNIGPDDPLPAEVLVRSGIDQVTEFEFRTWVTW